MDRRPPTAAMLPSSASVVHHVISGARSGRRSNPLLGGCLRSWVTLGTRVSDTLAALVRAGADIQAGAGRAITLARSLRRLLRAHDADEEAEAGHGVRVVDGARLTRRKGCSPRLAFAVADGVEIVCKILDASFATATAGDCSASTDRELMTLMEICVEILRDITSSFMWLSDDVAANHQLPWILFWMIKRQGPSPALTSLLEEMLSCSPSIYDITHVADFLPQLIMKLTDAEFCKFSRILAAVSFDSQMSECASVMAEVKAAIQSDMDSINEEEPPAPVVRKNQNILAGIDGLVPRLLLLLKDDDDLTRTLVESPEFFSIMVHMLEANDAAQDGVSSGNGTGGGSGADEGESEVSSSVSWRAELTRLVTEMLFSSSLRGISQDGSDRRANASADENEEWWQRAAPAGMNVRQVCMSLYKSEVLFVLSALVGGPDKGELKKTFIAAGLGPVMREMFEVIDWKCTGRQYRGIHGPNCSCSPTSGMKQQYLRLIRSFCEVVGDSTGLKRHFLSAEEFDELQAMAERRDIPSCDLGCVNRELCAGRTGKGVISRLVDVYQEMSPSSDDELLSHIVNVLEGWLRGSTEADRHWLEARGVLQRTLTLLLDGANTSDILRQSLFDLLAELCKYSHEMLHLLDCQLHKNKCDMLVALVEDQLVASNVFIRSCCLTTELVSQDESPRIVQFVLDSQRRRTLLMDLIMVVTPDSLNQDSLCVVTTILCFFVFAHRRRELTASLTEIRGSENGIQIIQNCYGLARFWRAYYSSTRRAKDAASLEQNCRIHFAEYLTVVNLVLDFYHKSIS